MKYLFWVLVVVSIGLYGFSYYRSGLEARQSFEAKFKDKFYKNVSCEHNKKCLATIEDINNNQPVKLYCTDNDCFQLVEFK